LRRHEAVALTLDHRFVKGGWFVADLRAQAVLRQWPEFQMERGLVIIELPYRGKKSVTQVTAIGDGKHCLV
jgi:hypothetical protein